ncbi:hypothetical protein BGI12_05995 [Snodgrassella alvi]|nr:hypothetical protein BGI12_05995 [Snodgrassella alvi]
MEISMLEHQEIKAAFCKGLESFFLKYKETKDLIKVLSDYVDSLDHCISNYIYKPKNDDDSAVTVKPACSNNNDDIIIQAHKGSESVTLATIKRDNTGAFAFKEFKCIGSDDGIIVNNMEDIKKALVRMLEEPALISALYRLIFQSGWPTSNNISDSEYEAMIIKGLKAIKNL